MAYTPTTRLPNLYYGQWSRPGAPNPTLNAPVSATEDIFTFSAPLLNHLGAAPTDAILIGIERADSYVETCLIPANGLSADGYTATGVIRGIRLSGIDYTTSDLTLAVTHEQGEPVFMNISAIIQEMLVSAIQGEISTNGINFTIGAGAAATITINRDNGSVLGWLRHNTATGKVQFSNDGAVWTNIDSVSASNLVQATAADTTPGYANDKIAAGTNVTKVTLNPGANEQIQINAAGPLATIVTDVVTTAARLNQLSAINASVSSANLNTLTGGPTSNADPLHTHNNPGKFTMVAGEAIDGSVNPKPICIIGKGYDSICNINASSTFGGGGTYENLGNLDANYRRAFRVSYTNANVGTIGVYRIGIWMDKVGNPVDNLSFAVYTDSGGTIPNVLVGTSATLGGGSLDATHDTMVYLTFAAPPGITSAVNFWVVVQRSGVVDAANYYRMARYTTGAGVSAFYTASGASWTGGGTFNFVATVEFEIDGAGRAFNANSGGDIDRKRFVGFSDSNVAALGSAIIQPFGLVSNVVEGAADPLVPGHTYYSNNGGQITDDTHYASMVGQAMTTTALLIQKGPIFSTATGFHHAQNITNVGAADLTSSDTVEIFVKTGFRPHFIRFYVDTSTAAANAERNTWVDFVLNNSNVYVTAAFLTGSDKVITNQSEIGNTNPAGVGVVGADNGFWITMAGRSDASYPSYNLFKYYAWGY